MSDGRDRVLTEKALRRALAAVDKRSREPRVVYHTNDPWTARLLRSFVEGSDIRTDRGEK